MRFAGIKQNKICVVSDSSFACPDYSVVAIPPELDQVHSEDLIAHYRVKDGSFVSKKERKPAKELKVALVCNLDDCGIATYSKCLFNELIPRLGDYKLFVETNDHLNLEGATFSPDKTVQCWKRGESLIPLANQIKEYDPDVVIIQNEFGIFPNAGHWLALMTQLSEYRVIVVMHSIFPTHRDKTVFEACIPEIVVHLEGAVQALRDKGVSSVIHHIPHGCYHFDKERLWNSYKSDHTIIQTGFGFSYKNFESSIITTSLLKEKYPDVFLTLLISENEHNKLGHWLYYQELLRLIDKLGVAENVGIVRGFQSDKVMDSFLRTNRVALFPYRSMVGHAVFGASGAARLAMSANMPVITSNIAHFSDLPTIHCETSEEMAKELDKLFSDEAAFRAQLEKQKAFVLSNTWAETAKRYVAILEEPLK